MTSHDKTTGPGGRERQRSPDEDDEHFARAMADVIRLDPDPRRRVRIAPHIGVPHRTAERVSSPNETGLEASLEAGFVASGVDRRELRKLKRGEHSPADRLDLHGMSAVQAVASVQLFIDQGRRGCRCVCVVHGRGLHSDGGVSILRARVRERLRQHPRVLAYADAPRADGGPGAVYVLLRK